jgi:4-amino-4-deoxychorismate lyase
MHDLYWYCGQSIESQTIALPINDLGLFYGATVFTTFRTDALEVYDRHCERLRSSIDDFGWHQPDWARVQSGVECLKTEFPILRITIFPDGRELITGRDLPPNLATWQQDGITVIIADRKFTRSLPQHKTGNYLAPWLALQQARNQNIQEAILTNDRGDWLETTTGNLWGYRDGCWYTPPLSAGILPGIARSQILQLLHQQSQKVLEIEWTAEWVKDLDSIGYSNSVIHLIPIHTVITPVGKLEYTVQYPMIWLATLLRGKGGTLRARIRFPPPPQNDPRCQNLFKKPYQ